MPGSVAAYITWMKLSGFSSETIRGRRLFFARIAAELPVSLDDATPEHLLAWRESLTISDRSVQRYISHLRCYYDWAVREACIRDDNPASRVPAPRAGRLLPRPVAEDELFDALESAPPRIRLMIVLAAWCGLRAKEIALLRRESILDTARPPVLIVASDATKGRNERAVPMCPFVVTEVRAAGLPQWGFAFLRMDGARGPNTPARVSQLIAAHFHSRGSVATAHRGRHWFGGEFYEASDCDVFATQQAMGHQSVDTTMGYVLLKTARSTAAVGRLPVPRRLRAAG